MVSAFNTASLGLLTSQSSFNTSAIQFINSFTPALGAAVGEASALSSIAQAPTNPNVNPFAGSNISPDAFVASSLSGLFSPNATDPATTLVSLLQAETAFLANLNAFDAINETENALLDIIA